MKRPSKEKSWFSITCIAWTVIVLWCFALYLLLRAGILKPMGLYQPQPIVVKQQNDHKPITSISSIIPSNVHVVFSTDCSFFQDWQTLLVFHSATIVGQKGDITRIASGCTPEQQKELTELYVKLFPQYHVHFTPDFKMDPKTKKKYDFYNKPYGLQHWLNYSTPRVEDGVVIALIDPDMIFLRPITTTLKGYDANIYMTRYSEAEKTAIPAHITRGAPAAQLYGLGAPWTNDRHKNFNRTDICGPGSACLSVSNREGELYYSVGPPYLVERGDMHKLTEAWTRFVPRVYDKYPDLLAEMYAYSMGAAHAGLPHTTLLHYMVSNTHMDEEGWQYIDSLGDDVCQPPDQHGVYYSAQSLPTMLHYCQFFRVGELGFQKRRVHKKLFTCDHPLMIEPALDIGKSEFKNRDGEIIPLSRTQARRNAFMICAIHRSLNSLLLYYKTHMCTVDQKINLEKTINIVKLPF